MRYLPLFCLGLLALTANAAEDAAPNFAADTLTGDWGGTRSNWAKSGVMLEGGVKIDSLSNRGARRNGSKTVSHVDLKLKLDLEKSLGWHGGSAMLNVIRDAGRGLNDRHVSSLLGVTNLEVPFPTTTSVFHAWVKQQLWDERFSILAGIYPIDSEFQVVDSAGVFVKPEYGPSGDLALTRGPSIFNNAAFGIRSKLSSADKTVYGQWALMDGIPNDPARPKRTAVRFAKGDGAFNVAEIGWLPNAADEKFTGHSKFALGLWAYTAKSNDQLDVANIDAGNFAGPASRRRQHGGYVLGERTVARLDADRFVSAFVRHAWTDGDSSPLTSALNLGVSIKGPFASRPDDILGLAWSRAATSSRWRAAQAVGGTATDTAETALEWTYKYNVTPWFAIQPNYQYIRHPGAVRGVPNARIIGARFEFVL